MIAMEEQESSKKKNPKNLRNKGIQDFARYSGMAFQMIGIILVTVWGGVKLDKLTGLENTGFYNSPFPSWCICSNLYCP